jgi:hypothetical protein
MVLPGRVFSSICVTGLCLPSLLNKRALLLVFSAMLRPTGEFLTRLGNAACGADAHFPTT